ncbi:TPA: YsgD/CorL family protein [Salmonella enterica subsp. enterica serovar Chester]|uniref:Uncharacterized protein n=11 Tax=Salmonella enterica TaxID=28901 RepID=A0A8F6SD04_SALET|nr:MULTISPECIES: YsgD/CorL family protein [Salmonella]MCL9029965.1 hypothetical protein [Salmonella enterica subsp. enterica serovar Enteritidis]MDK9057667.1 YsgD/CorL family protein [Salmonella enterica subsp. enterica serovar Jangwani]MDK9124335.1 YsgD/CorL family protein [Salmonella enterica subsp. enterica serovar B:l,v:-]QVT24576.1 hypothetical protein AT812_22810 [Salmonella enterica subsp. enterica serovar Tennessee]UGJ94577.1 hypothetical protein LQT34_00600 [Escherichia coli]WOP35281
MDTPSRYWLIILLSRINS